MPEHERRLDQEARERLDTIQDAYAKFSLRVRIILGALFIAQLALGLLSIHLLSQNERRSAENHVLIRKVQDERAYAVRVQCEDVNRRNAAAQAELENLVPKGTPPERVRPTQILLDRVLPSRNCDRFVAQLVGTVP